MNTSTPEDLRKEAAAFDAQILERVRNGHIPDLRRSGRCEYFYNNVWRDQFFTNLYFGELVKRVVKEVKTCLAGQHEPLKLLEVGCGPGHVSLELARNGFDVTGLDISNACIDIARQFAEEDPWKNQRSSLKYVKDDFLNHNGTYHVVLFTASLHHFPQCKRIIKHTAEILKDWGLIIADEPIKDQVSERNAAIILLIKGLLSAGGSYYEQLDIPTSKLEMEKICLKINLKESYREPNGENVQSIHDNVAGFEEMHTELKAEFEEIKFEKHHALFHQLIGGVRLDSIEDERKMALFLKQMDEMLCRLNAIDPTNFYFVGRKSIK